MPILVRGECRGVLEFFSREPRPPDSDMQEMMTNLGRQIGQFIERHQMHSRVVQSERLASLVQRQQKVEEALDLTKDQASSQLDADQPEAALPRNNEAEPQIKE